MVDRWTPPKADEHLKRPSRDVARVVVEDKPMVWPQPCRWQAALNRRLFGIVTRAAGAGVFLTMEQLEAAVAEKGRCAAELRQMFGDARAPVERLKELDQHYADRMVDAAGIHRRFAVSGASGATIRTGPVPAQGVTPDRAASAKGGSHGEARGPDRGADRRPGGEEAVSPGGDGPAVPRDAAGLGDSQDDLWWSGLEELDTGRDDEP